MVLGHQSATDNNRKRDAYFRQLANPAWNRLETQAWTPQIELTFVWGR